AVAANDHPAAKAAKPAADSDPAPAAVAAKDSTKEVAKDVKSQDSKIKDQEKPAAVVAMADDTKTDSTKTDSKKSAKKAGGEPTARASAEAPAGAKETAPP